MTETFAETPARGPSERAAVGREARVRAPRSSHGDWHPAADRPDPVKILTDQAEGRVGGVASEVNPHLVFLLGVEFVREIYSRLEGRDDFTWEDVVALVEEEKSLMWINAGVRQKELYDS